MAKTKVTGEYLKDSVVRFTAKAGENITKGNAVYISGISGELPVVSLADADNTAKMPAFGLAEATVSTNDELEVTSFGTLANLDTSSYTLGDILYVGTTAGALTNDPAGLEATKLQNIGIVQRVHASNGSIKVGGAGRTNAVPNLDDGDIFIGDSNNKAVSSALSTEIESYLDGGTSTPTFASATVSGDLTVDTNRLYVDSTNDRVGIALSTPPHRFSVGSANDDGIALYDGTNDLATIFRENNDQARFSLLDTGTVKVKLTSRPNDNNYINNGGKVGIGTNNPTSRLEVQDDSSNTTGASGAFIDINNTNTATGASSGIRFLNGTTAAYKGAIFFKDSAGDGRGDLIFATNNVGSGADEVDFDNARMTILAGGNVGIGTDDPQAPLHINGDTFGSVLIDGTDSIRPSTDDSLITISGGDATNSGANYTLFGGTHATLANIHRWRVGGTEAMRINSSGNVGIGLGGADPSATLDVDGTIKLDGNYPTGTSNVALGNTALDSVTASGNGQNIAIGDSALTANTSGERNIAIGANALAANVDTDRNIAIGAFALDAAGATESGEKNNIAIGYNSQSATTTGEGNVSIGSISLDANTTGSGNVAIGWKASTSSQTATNTVAIGRDALADNDTGSTSVAVGAFALQNNTTGKNVALGYRAGQTLLTGVGNIAIGGELAGVNFSALNSATTGNYNIAIGTGALADVSTSSNNLGIGYNAGANISTGTFNVAIGNYSLDANTTTSHGTAIGYEALSANTVSFNTAVGSQALKLNSAGDSLVAVGSQALAVNTTGSGNTAVGRDALGSNTTASNNTAIGKSALYANQTGTNNVAVGALAGDSITTGSYNVIMGAAAGQALISGSSNTAIGEAALYSNTAQGDNVAVGTSVLYNSGSGYQSTSVGSVSSYNTTTGYRNVAVGYAAHYNGTSGANNTSVGWYAGYGLSTGNSNICIGYGAGYNNGTNAISTGDSGIYIGVNSSGNNDGSKEIVLGHELRGIGGDRFTFGTGAGNDRVYNSYTVDASWTRVSDERYKTEIQDNNDCGLNFINDLRPVTFKWKAKSDIDADLPDYNPEETEPKHKEKLYGLIAQEVKEALKKNNITDFGGWNVEESSGIQAISQEMFIHPLIKAVQELSSQVESLKQEINDIKGGN